MSYERWLVAYALIFGISLANAAEIHDVIRSAFRQSWEIENAKYLRLNADADYRSSIYSFFPNINVAANHGFQGGSPAPGNDRTADYYIEAKASIFSMAQADSVSIARAGRDLQNLRFSEQQNQFLLDAVNLYLNYLLEKKRVQNLANIATILEKQFEITASEYRQGLKPRKDYLRLRAELRGTQLDQVQEEIALKSAEDVLRDKVRADFGRFTFDPNLLGTPEPAKSKLIDEDRDVDHSIKEKSGEAEVQLLNREKSKANHDVWPQLTLGANYKISDSDFWHGSQYEPDKDKYWSITLGISYTLFDWGTQRRNRETAIRNALLRENEVYQEMRTAQIDYDLSSEKLRVARRTYTERTLLLGDERESYNIISRDFREGRIDFIDYVSSVRSFGTAELSVFQALIDLNKAYYEILLHRGELDEYFSVR